MLKCSCNSDFISTPWRSENRLCDLFITVHLCVSSIFSLNMSLHLFHCHAAFLSLSLLVLAPSIDKLYWFQILHKIAM